MTFLTDSLAQLGDRKKLDLQTSHLALVGRHDMGAEHEISPVGIGLAEDPQGIRIKGVGVPLALDSIDSATSSGNHKVHLPARGIAPEVNLLHRSRHQRIQDEMLPEEAAVFGAELIPATGMTDKSGVESIELWPRDKFPATASGEGSQEMGDVGCLQDLHPVHDRRTTYPGVFRERSDLQKPTALTKDQFHQQEKCTALLHAEHFLNVPGEIGVEPLGVEFPVRLFRKKGRREATAQESVVQIRYAKGGQFLCQHRGQHHRALSAGQRIPELSSGCKCGGTRCQHTEVGKDIGGDLQHAARISKLMNLIEDDQGLLQRSEEGLRICQPRHIVGKIAVQELRIAKFPGQDSLSSAAYTRQPDQRYLRPGTIQATPPERAINHKQVHFALKRMDVKCGFIRMGAQSRSREYRTEPYVTISTLGAPNSELWEQRSSLCMAKPGGRGEQARARQYAYASSDQQNGLFTYALMEALDGKGHPADAKSPEVTMSEVAEYVKKRVGDLTNHKQTPNARRVNLEGDFALGTTK